MTFGFGFGFPRALGVGGFSPASLFAAGEVGAWYDPSDLTTLFQDTAGTLPVTTPGQTVALMLDKSGRGNHATQGTSFSQPFYAIEPMTGRRNLLTFTEQFDNSGWAKTQFTLTANATTAPDDTATADLVTPSNNPNGSFVIQTLASTSGVLSYYAKESVGRYFIVVRGSYGANDYAVFDLRTGAITQSPSFAGSTAQIVDAGGGWYRCVLRSSQATTINAFSVSGAPTGLDIAAPGGVFLWGAQLETGSTATAYQRVTTQYDVTEAGVASKSYLFFDGINDGMQTGTITPGVDKVQVFAGVRKLSDAGLGIVAETSSSGAVGSFTVAAPEFPTPIDGHTWESRGVGAAQVLQVDGFAAPRSLVITGQTNLAAPSMVVRTNGNQTGSSTPALGGSFNAYPLYIGRRGGTQFPFQGHIYGLIVRFSATNLDAATITSTETWLNSRTGAY